MKTTPGLTAMALLLAAATGNVAAGPGHHDGWGPKHGGEYGRVIRVKPIYETVEVRVPEEHCSEGYLGQAADLPGNAALAGAVAGGVVGAIAGDRFGRGKAPVTVAGAVLGGAIGYEVGPDVAGWYPASEWIPGGCETVDRSEFREEVVGYRVKYRYRGHVYHTRTAYHPGDQIRVDRRARPFRF